MAEAEYDRIRDRFLEFEAICREYAGASPATADPPGARAAAHHRICAVAMVVL